MNSEIKTIDLDESEPEGDAAKQLASLAASLFLHFILLLSLAVVIVSKTNPVSGVISLDASRAMPDGSVELLSLEMMADSEQETFSEELQSVDLESQLQEQPEIRVQEDQLRPDKLLEPSRLQDLAAMSGLMTTPEPLDSTKREKTFSEMMKALPDNGTSQNGPPLKDPKEGVRQTRTTAAAAAGIFDQLRDASDHDGPIWILWVMDASISLVGERQQLAPLVQGFYDELKLAKKPGVFPWPSTAVFAFGKGVLPLGVNKGMPRPSEIASTLINVPIDQSGVENVLTAVSSAVASVPFKNPNTRIEVVVWTDESGDDLVALENAIMLCRQRHARVHVVGPLSVLGMRKGLQQFTLPFPYNQPILLPVDRGPDSAFPERAELPYWYESTDIDWGNGPIIPANLGPKNFGGPHRQRLLAPSGPYGLTRLALATGGTFTAINRPGDIATNTREELFDYMPDYRSAYEIAYDIDRYPLRRAVIEAAALTGTADYWPPRMDFPTYQSDQFPYRSFGLYQTPQRFSKTLPEQLERSVDRLRRAQVVIEQAIQVMMMRFEYTETPDSESSGSLSEQEMNEITLDQVTPSEYYKEQSPRWKAWYDLNLGRLLAHSVRIQEFVLQCEILATSETRTMMLSQGFNKLRMTASAELKGGSVSNTRAQTAAKLLERVVEEHADTPWGDLAAWELEHPVGVKPILSVRPPPRRVGPVRRKKPMPRPTLPRL